LRSFAILKGGPELEEVLVDIDVISAGFKWPPPMPESSSKQHVDAS
jgi:hypothetical protein